MQVVLAIVTNHAPSCTHTYTYSPSDLVFLPAIARGFPECHSDSLKRCLELLLLLEILLISDVQSNILMFFPSAFRSTWLKGAYSDEGNREVVQKNMQIKRSKVHVNLSCNTVK